MAIPTQRLLLVSLLGTIPIVLSASRGFALLVAAGWILGIAALACIDATTVSPGSMVWSREHESKLSLGAWNTVRITVHNRSAHPIQFRVREAVPSLLQPRGEAGEGRCEPGSSWTLQYRLFPVQRGDFQFGKVTARYLGILGLVWRQRSHEIGGSVKVYPNLIALAQYDALVRRGQLYDLGLRSSRRYGSGTEFERLRDYTPGDEYRRISWNATARRGNPVVVHYETERSQNVILALDTGRLMSTKLPLEEQQDADLFMAQPLTRLDHATNAALMLSYVSQQVGDRVGLLAFGDRVHRYVAPRAGRTHFLTIADALYNLQPESTEPDYNEALAYLASRSSRRCLVVLFTDISSKEAGEALARSLAVAARRHLPIVVTLRDPEVNRLAREPVETVTDVYERAVARIWLDERRLTLRSVRQRGALTVDTSADAISTDVINRYLEVKARSLL